MVTDQITSYLLIIRIPNKPDIPGQSSLLVALITCRRWSDLVGTCLLPPPVGEADRDISPLLHNQLILELKG
jgi:hypothetical protein